MEHIRAWLDATACPAVDPDQDRRVSSQARELAACMRKEGKFFSLRESSDVLHVLPEDMALVKDRLYELALKFVLKNFVISDKDRMGLGWIARNLGLEAGQARLIELRVGRRVFEEFLGFGISGGYLDKEELTLLRTIAASLQVSTADLVISYLTEKGEDFLKRIFTGMPQDGVITDESWNRLLKTLGELGVSETQFLAALRPHGPRWAEKLLNEAKVLHGLVEIDLRPVGGLMRRLRLAPATSTVK
jgi:hypothetical protein